MQLFGSVILLTSGIYVVGYFMCCCRVSTGGNETHRPTQIGDWTLNALVGCSIVIHLAAASLRDTLPVIPCYWPFPVRYEQ